jgi:hypothetical protein
MIIVIILILIAALVCFYGKVNKHNIEGFKSLKVFYNKKHKMVRRKIRPQFEKLQGYWNRFSKKYI